MFNLKHYQLFLIIHACLIIFSGCSKPRITGKVIDEAMKPLSGVGIGIINTSLSAETGNDGEYAIDFAPGKITLIASKDGYTSDTLRLEINQLVKYPAKDIRLLKILEPGNFVLLTDSGYISLNRGFIFQNAEILNAQTMNQLRRLHYNVVGINADSALTTIKSVSIAN